MSTIQAIILGIVQGLTEFLPVSSSGHLVLVPWWLGWENPGLAFDTLLHWGTLLAVVIYFWRDWWEMLLAVVNRIRGRATDGKDRLLLLIIIGSLPAAVIGYLFDDFFESLFHSPAAATFFMILTGFILVFAERWHRTGGSITNIKLVDALFIGFAQALAIAPGISRSGSTIAAVGDAIDEADADVIDVSGLVVAPGLVDIHVHLREPGREDEETIESGTEAAVHGGVTTLAAMPNTDPVIDDVALVDFILRRAREERGAAKSRMLRD